MQPKRAIAYIDGFNLYHAIDDLRRPHLKWVNLWQLCADLLRKNESLEAIHYFSAYATWKPDAMARHHEYTKALAYAGVTTHMARFKEKPRSCKTCGARWMGHEEKETDVQIALSIVRDAFAHALDRRSSSAPIAILDRPSGWRRPIVLRKNCSSSLRRDGHLHPTSQLRSAPASLKCPTNYGRWLGSGS